jgi:hypothetical protein
LIRLRKENAELAMERDVLKRSVVLRIGGLRDAKRLWWREADFLHWQSYSGAVSEFLTDLVLGEVGNLNGLSPTELSTKAPFRAFNATASPKVTSAPRWGNSLPDDEFAELAQVIGAKSGPEPESTDWLAVERQLQVPLPADYKSFIDMYGTGTFCDIRIVGPGASGDFDMFALTLQQYERAGVSNRSGISAFQPDVGGLLAWGETLDGWTCNWRITDLNPDKWGVAMVAPNFQPVFHDELSFSSFLLKYCGHRDQLGVFFARTPWQGGVAFVPQRH